MMKKLLCIGLVVALAGVTANAATLSTWADGALRIKLRVDYVTGESWLINMNSTAGQGGAVDSPLNVDGYTITSLAGNLVPTLTYNTNLSKVTGWFSIADAVTRKTVATLGALGENVAGFGRMNPTTFNCSEVNSSGSAYFRYDTPADVDNNTYVPTTNAYDTPWLIGKPLKAASASYSDLKFFYKTPTSGGDQFVGQIEIINIPEPATMGVLAIGGMAALLRKRRRS